MDTSYYYIIGFAYLAICVWIAAEGDIRGHGGFYVFMFCVICSPLLGAIMFHSYKPEKDGENGDSE